MTSSNPGQGAKRDKAEYICYMGANHRNGCKGQRAYVAKRVEDIVLQATRLMPELQIIDQELFDQAQEIVTQRKTKNAEWRNIPRQNGNGALLGGNLYCATCGRRMTSSNPGKGAKRDKAEYMCNVVRDKCYKKISLKRRKKDDSGEN